MREILMRHIKREVVIRISSVVLSFSHFWGVTVWLYNMPSLILVLTVGELFGSFAYALFFVLVESLIVLALILFIYRLTAKWVSGELITIAVFVFSLNLVPLTLSIFYVLQFPFASVSVYLVASSILTALWYYSAPMMAGLFKFIDQLSVLAFVYFAFDILALCVISIRNLI